MNQITKTPIANLGYDFIPAEFLPEGKNEYYLRDEQNEKNKTEKEYRHLTFDEVEELKDNGNKSDDWTFVMVMNNFQSDLVRNCNFFGSVRIGNLEPFYVEFHNLRRPVGLYNSTIISCDIGDNVVIDNVSYLSHYIIGNDVILININEIETTDHAKFGNGMLKEGEPESIRIQLEICNENGGRSIIPFNGMLPGDAWLFSRYRDDQTLQAKLRQFSDQEVDSRRGFYGTIGERTVIKNCKIIKDVKIGTDAYLKGANKLKNLTINSSADSKTQIGEGCELVNGIIGLGCRIFYGVKAVRFILASHSQLKYGARLINSYLGNNSTISCCEVLNSLIFPAHEQHHNNSFLCASLLMGQSNMAAGATVGSNHNSRGADGELIAGRGFWPGLCVSIKHNSRFASFIIMAKGDYPAELDIPLPFSLVSNDVANEELIIMPCYWFLHNMYALARNAWKYEDRDKRIEKTQLLEYDYLAPDSMNEVVAAIGSLELIVCHSWMRQADKPDGLKELEDRNLNIFSAAEDLKIQGRSLLLHKDNQSDQITFLAEGFENSKRPVKILKLKKAYGIYRELVAHYAVRQMVNFMESGNFENFSSFQQQLTEHKKPEVWVNAGGQLIKKTDFDNMLTEVRVGKITGWNDIHNFYRNQADHYSSDKMHHAFDLFYAVFGISIKHANGLQLKKIFEESLSTAEWLAKEIFTSREKDYLNPFRQMVYENEKEMEQVMGRLLDNSFINSQYKKLSEYRISIGRISELVNMIS